MQNTKPAMTILNTTQGTAQFPTVRSKRPAQRSARGTSLVGNQLDATA